VIKCAPVFLLLGVFVLGVAAQDATKPAQSTSSADSKIPDDAKKQVNPIKPSADSVAEGKKIYSTDCAMCHNANGDGKGDLAADMKLNLVDLRDSASLKDVTDGEIFYLIKNGKGDMPPEGDRLKTNEIWNVVNYVRSLAKKDAAEK